MKELEPYLVEFKIDDIIKIKNYLLDYIIKSGNCQPIIVIMHNKYTF